MTGKPEPVAETADGCGCQYDAAGRRFRSRCICPPPMTPDQTIRGVAGLGGAIGDAVRDLASERDALLTQVAELRDEADHWHTLRERLHTEIRGIVGDTPREQRSGDADADLIQTVRSACGGTS